MQLYTRLFSIALQDLLEYRLDHVIRALRYGLAIGLYGLLWLAINRESPQLNLNPQELIRYYLLAAILYGASNFHLDYVEADIRLGKISIFLLKPLSSYLYYYFIEAVRMTFEVFFKSVVFFPIAYLFGLRLETTIGNLLLFYLMLPLIFTYSYTVYFTVSSLAFRFHRAEALRMSVMFFSRFVSGVYVPLYFLPHNVVESLFALPFPHLAFTPIQIALGEFAWFEVLASFVILFSWTMFFILLQKFIWQRMIHHYESTGI